MEIYFTDRGAIEDLANYGISAPQVALDLFNGLYIPDGMPFLLGDDGSYPESINSWLRSLPSHGCTERGSWRGYGYDVLGFANFIVQTGRGIDPILATLDDVVAYRDKRRNGSPPEVTATTMNRCLAALQKLFGWRKAHLGIDDPFHYRIVAGNPRNGRKAGKRNSLLERTGGSDAVRFISLEEFQLFRDVGLRGCKPSPTPADPTRLVRDADFVCRHGERNGLIADGLLNSGARVTEFLAVLLSEVPLDPKLFVLPGSSAIRLAAAATKTKLARDIRIPNSALRRIDHYSVYARSASIKAALERGAYEGNRRLVLISPAGNGACQVARTGARERYDTMNVERRRSLMLWDHSGAAGPAVLFLTADGAPMTGDALRVIFARACQRCASFGIHLNVSPHVLRHSFAVIMLRLLSERWLRANGDPRRYRDAQGEDALRVAFNHPLLVVRDLLGHTSVESTFKYLTYITDTFTTFEAEFPKLAPFIETSADYARSAARTRGMLEGA
ncbi:tyrosine-type recombinase/integrase [Lichenifustis flavocetrariae]|uniref:Site-specific integrase n=1 Tax=Lichenifustis flavocetrariae TaxID=2949735 RepID=A0AA42CRT7_9HYPH|nr:tyrosine-type recombinase/integrase [Lichenifustis flavocetrariae]MCW6512800.1 site-specific integrase [Lichenifustis flavocetrariae]